jgi:hypothetical protein
MERDRRKPIRRTRFRVYPFSACLLCIRLLERFRLFSLTSSL